ncbi:DEAD/DEAH box helicase [Myxococcota bacterium]|nr:DEAD/DEAH box helicase [Myxococcota bacterium]
MFDAETVRLIQDAEPIEGLDLNQLPQILTAAYAQVVAVRLGAVNIGDGQKDAEWAENLDLLRRLADTYEGLSIFLPEDNPHRASCAFVAASAHHTLSQARQIEARRRETEVETPSLTLHGVGPEVAACLLFLLSGHQADAAETTKLFKMPESRTPETELLCGLSSLASGDGEKLKAFAADKFSAPIAMPEADYLERAAASLWTELARAVWLIGRVALGRDVSEQPDEVILAVIRRLELSRLQIPNGEQPLIVRPRLAGPYHFARLLRHVSGVLLASMIVRVSAPSGVEPGRWSDFVREIAARRPFLWRNHVSAVSSGFLNQGHSFVLTFPTGAGKTTVTELRIAAELLRGRKVVFLAPTRALVDQVSRDLSERLIPIADSVVRGQLLEDYGEDAAGRVFVQTPEQCLAYLSFDAEAHKDLGLVVVDEAHQLSGEPPAADGSTRLPGRRAVDAMWTLLSLLQRSPDADVVLISAMVRNGKALTDWLGAVTSRPASVLELPWKPTRQVRGVIVYEASEIAELNKALATRKRRSRASKPGKADKADIQATPVGLFCHTQVWATYSSFAKLPVLSGPVPLEVNAYWKPTANRNVVGGRLLGAMAQAKMRPIVFSQQIGWTASIAKVGANFLAAANYPEVDITDEERTLLEAAAVELGDPLHVEGICEGRIGVHHGLLLVPERAAVESAFRRSNGLLALVATPTVAQGINLPAEAVVIAGDDRYTNELDEGAMQPLAVHELLNAAGRAGRAGHYAHGLVINLPRKVLTVEEKNKRYIVPDLEHMMSLFGLPDQCLDVVDPITQVLDRIQSSSVDADVCEYVVRRAAGIPNDQLVRILGAAFGNAVATDRVGRAAAQAELLREHGAALDLAQQEEIDEPDLDRWKDFASQIGVSPFVIARIAAVVPPAETVTQWAFEGLRAFAIENVTQHLFDLVNPMSAGLSQIMPRAAKTQGKSTAYTESVDEWEARWRAAVPEVVQAWIGGEAVARIGQRLHTRRGATGRVNAVHLGRRFALHSTPSIAHGASVVVRIVETLRADAMSAVLRLQLPLISGCIREGFDDPDKLLLFWHLRRVGAQFPRVVVHSKFASIQSELPAWSTATDLDQRRRHIRTALGDDYSGSSPT